MIKNISYQLHKEKLPEHLASALDIATNEEAPAMARINSIVLLKGYIFTSNLIFDRLTELAKKRISPMIRTCLLDCLGKTKLNEFEYNTQSQNQNWLKYKSNPFIFNN